VGQTPRTSGLDVITPRYRMACCQPHRREQGGAVADTRGAGCHLRSIRAASVTKWHL
jgi:hypothetical protein